MSSAEELKLQSTQAVSEKGSNLCAEAASRGTQKLATPPKNGMNARRSRALSGVGHHRHHNGRPDPVTSIVVKMAPGGGKAAAQNRDAFDIHILHYYLMLWQNPDGRSPGLCPDRPNAFH